MRRARDQRAVSTYAMQPPAGNPRRWTRGGLWQGRSPVAGELRRQGLVGEHGLAHPRGEFGDAFCRMLADALLDIDEVGGLCPRVGRSRAGSG